MSTHSVPVIEVKEVLPHPNADKLEIIPVGGWRCCVQKGAFKPGDLAVYIEPDYMVPVTRPEFAFLKEPSKIDQTYARIRGKKLRGIMSFGLLIPAPVEAFSMDSIKPGDDLMSWYGIARWEPPMVSSSGATQGFTMARTDLPGLDGLLSKFDIESVNNYPFVLQPNEDVIVTEKVHGANARYMWWQGEFYIGSRSHWLRDPSPEERDAGHKDTAWRVAAWKFPAIEQWCAQHEGTVLYGEIYGNIQDLKYGLPNDVAFVAFAARDCVTGQWLDTLPLLSSCDLAGVPRVPVLATGPISIKLLDMILEEDSAIPSAPDGHMREGVIITPAKERHDPEIGRVSLKLISNRYWERKL